MQKGRNMEGKIIKILIFFSLISSNLIAVEKYPLDVEHDSIYAHFIDQKDINNDGIDDFIIGTGIDTRKQIGVEGNKVKAKDFARLQGNPPVLFLSNGNSFDQYPFPKNSQSIRSWAGKIFKHNDVWLFYWGRNGEVGISTENIGEKSQLWKIETSPAVSFELIYESEFPTVTADVQVEDINRDGDIEILENNYNGIRPEWGPDQKHYQSRILTIFSKSLMVDTWQPKREEFLPYLKKRLAHNTYRVRDINHDGNLDLLVSTEKYTGKYWSGSPNYALMDFVHRNKPLELDWTIYGENAASSYFDVWRVQDRTLLLSTYTDKVENGPYLEFEKGLFQVHELTSNNETKLIYSNELGKMGLGNKANLWMQLSPFDMDDDGIEEMYFESYSSGGMRYLKYENGEIAVKKAKTKVSSVFHSADSKGELVLVRYPQESCYRALSVPNIMWEQSQIPKILVSDCIKF